MPRRLRPYWRAGYRHGIDGEAPRNTDFIAEDHLRLAAIAFTAVYLAGHEAGARDRAADRAAQIRGEASG